MFRDRVAGRPVVAGVLALALSGAALAGCAAHRAAPAADDADGLPHTTVQVSLGRCGTGWSHPRSGVQVFDIHNASDAPTEVDLIDPRTQAVYGEVEGLGPGTTRPMQVTVGGGSYAFKCLPDDADAMTGGTVTVPGHAPAGPSAPAVSEQDVIPATIAYQKWIGGRMTVLAARAGVLKGDIDRGDLAAARRDWLTAHLVYETMGAAYDTFGAADGEINGTTAGLDGGVTDKDFTGFHRIEYGLWHGASAAALKPFAARLTADIGALRRSWPQARMDPLQMGLRAHEILENTVQFELTGRTDYGSHSNLATAAANLAGTREVLSGLRAQIAARYRALPQLDASLARLSGTLDGVGHGGHYPPLDDLSRTRREQLDAAADDAVERLADIAAIFDIRRTS
ncbi:EfeM/EfeO family lipoprotein [Streptantibioticus silvisoli]|uniref:EfeM/EfeO family lipoprotein n=1 Tax=Streptantibioticus silvisoli TaxID=2705255 RepID=A0ABT6WAB1_9ACTN|nr:EfeM/EfeO family lipoprotein [Streptantibioticus silvisoli]MDI5967232.1 EfeM/EfeO family lipoprotein [Streptantibioticus silvisoli]